VINNFMIAHTHSHTKGTWVLIKLRPGERYQFSQKRWSWQLWIQAEKMSIDSNGIQAMPSFATKQHILSQWIYRNFYLLFLQLTKENAVFY